MGRLALLLTVVVLCLLDREADGFGSSRVARSNNDIDNYIFGLNYSDNQVLAYKGDSIDSVPVQKEGNFDSKKDFIVITRTKKTLQNGKSEIGVVTANEHMTYPGSLLLANERLIDNSPDVLAFPRGPLTYTVNLPGLTSNGHFTIDPSFANYQAAKEKTVNIWFEKYPKDQSLNAIFQSDSSFAYSKEYLRVKFGLDFKATQIESQIDFNAMSNQEKLIMIYKFKQIFYTVSVEPTVKPSDLFGPNVSVEDLKQRTNSSSPPVLVDSVSYGRSIYVKIETSSTDSDAKAILTNNLTTFDISNKNEVQIKKNLKNLNMQVYVFGGSTEQVNLIKAQTFKEVNDVLLKNRKFSRDNIGYPISYSTEFVKDNSRAVVQMATDYIETTRTVQTKGIIKIKHTGWFVMRWWVTWGEVSYNKTGAQSVNEKSWERNGDSLTAPFERDIELPGNAEEIRVIAKELTALPWEEWRTVIDRSGIPLIKHRKFVVWGTTLSPKYKISPAV